MVGVSFSPVKSLVGEKYWSLLKTWSLFTGSFSLIRYTDDATPCTCGNTFLETTWDLETTINILFDWFCYDSLKTNSSNCNLLLLTFNLKSINIKSSSEKLLRVTVHSKFIFKKHITHYAEIATKSSVSLRDVLNTRRLKKEMHVACKSVKQPDKWSPSQGIKDNLSWQNFLIWQITQNWPVTF